MTEQYIPISAREPLYHTVEKPIEGSGPFRIQIKRATPYEKQMLHSRVLAAGLKRPSNAQIRAAEVNALIKILGDEAGEEAATALETFYQDRDHWLEALMEHAQREVQRKIDEENGAEPIAPEPAPVPAFTERQKASAELLIYQARDDKLVARLYADSEAYNAGNAFWLVRTHIVPGALIDAPKELVMTFDRDGLLDQSSLDDLIGFMGDEEFSKLVVAINDQYELAESEEKNSSSPPSTSSPKEPPMAPMSEPLEKPNGENLTAQTPLESSTGPIPASEFVTTIVKSPSMPSEPTASMESIIQTDNQD